MLYAIVGMLVIILDQGVKFWVTNHIMLNTVTEPLIPGVISLVRMHNDGAAFSFLAGGGARIYFIILTGVFTVAVILALVTNFINGRFGRWCLVLVTAGGLSNCLDRVLYGYVVDMFKVELFDFAVFNVADIFITVFCLLFIIYIIFGGEDKKNHDDEFGMDDEDLDRPSMPKRDKKALRQEKKEEKAAAKLAKRDKKRGAKYDEDEEEMLAPRYADKKRRSREEDMQPLPSRAESRRRPAAEDMPQRSSRGEAPERRRASQTVQSGDTARRSVRKSRDQEDYEAFMAARPNARAEMTRKSMDRNGAARNTDDPFAAWERANAKLENRHSSTARAMGVEPPARGETSFRRPSGEQSAQRAPQPSAADRAAAQQAMRERAAAAARSGVSRERSAAALPGFEAEAPAAPRAERRPSAPAAAPAPAAKPKTKVEDELEFSLDDILSEFR